MKRIVLSLVLAVLFASQAFAVEHEAVAVGFHHVSAPLGIRWWFTDTQSMAFDIGIGFSSRDEGEDRETDFNLDLGLPILLKSWDRVHFLFRPGFGYTSYSRTFGDEVERGSFISILAELEAEVFITEQFSVSASHGLGIFIDSPPEPEGQEFDSTTDFATIGNNITDIGFHLYGLWD
jgi:hypothetical protein